MSLEIDSFIREEFNVEEVDVRTYSPLTLAYIGDGVFDLIIRTVVVGRGNTQPNKLHNRTCKIVKAETQSRMIDALSDSLTEEEFDVYRRGRNAKSFTKAKNASTADYRNATGFEALMGYLYITNRLDRAVELTRLALDSLNMEV